MGWSNIFESRGRVKLVPTTMGDGENSPHLLDEEGNLKVSVNGLIIPRHDEVSCAYDSNNNLISVIYKLAGTTVATLSLSYDSDNNLIGVVKS